MKKIIHGKTYNTDTAKNLGTWTNGHYPNDFDYCEESLYRNNRGTYFLHGDGGAKSKYGVWRGNTADPGEEIIPMTEEEAMAWAEKHLAADEYESIFGEQDEPAPSDLTTRERVNVVLDSALYARLKAYSQETGIPVSRLLDKAIQQTYFSE